MKKRYAVIDTNVVVSAALKHSSIPETLCGVMRYVKRENSIIYCYLLRNYQRDYIYCVWS